MGVVHTSLTVDSFLWSKWLKFCIDKTGSSKNSSELASKAIREYMEGHQ